ncbi:MAG: ArgE/DapE family deacylase [Opitutaceae bacterium]|nr:ArgE/DapE family deacylase [Opitutaceae bacterium]
MSESIELLKSLIRIPSVNPVYGGPGELQVQEFVENWLSKRAIDYRLQEVFPGRNNVVARIGPADKPAILIEAHMDTVGVDGWAMGDPFEPVEKDGRLYGRGSCDTKASLATFLQLAECLAARESDLKYALLFAATVDEESQQHGAFKLSELVGDMNVGGALTGEPTRSEIVTKHKGACRYSIQARGKAAHGSTPELGENAIYKIARIVEKLNRCGTLMSQEETLPFIERGSLNVGKIGGGIGFNIVPDSCSIELDRRLGVNEAVESAREGIESIVNSESGVSVSSFLERPALNTDNSHWFPQALEASARKHGVTKGFREVSFMTNGVAYSSVGVPTVVFGPGDIAQAHKTDEYIEFGEMERSLAILEELFVGE